jgi:small ligand-binding sensory domain FIST
MRFGSAIATTGMARTSSKLELADELLGQLDATLDGQAPDLLLFFNASEPRAPLHGRDVAQVLRERCAERWPGAAPVVLGSSWSADNPGTGIIGGGEERQQSAALTVLGARLPGVQVLPFHAEPEHDGLPTLVGATSWAELAMLPKTEAPHVLVLTDPSQFGLGRYSDTILRYMDNVLPFSTKVGGLVPGGGLISLDCDGGAVTVGTQGVGGVVLHGNIVVDTMVCQGAAPFGPEYQITACDGPSVLELDGQPAAQILSEMLQSGQQPDNTQHILAGVALDTDPTRDELAPAPSTSAATGAAAVSAAAAVGAAGQPPPPSERISSEFVLRHVVHVDSTSGAIRIDVAPELLREGTRFQLHSFSRQAALEEISAHSLRLAQFHADAGVRPAGALLVSCLGRGRHLYGEDGIESGVLAAAWQEAGPLPVAGFFAGGEIGPVGFRSYTHSYTSSSALFRPREASGVN